MNKRWERQGGHRSRSGATRYQGPRRTRPAPEFSPSRKSWAAASGSGCEPDDDKRPSSRCRPEQGVGQNSNHRQHDKGDALVHRRLFEMRVSSKGLECGGVDGPAASAQLVNELRRDRSEFHIARIKVGALKRDLFFLFVSQLTWLLNFDALDLLDTDCFDHTHAAVGDRPVDFRQVPKREISLPADHWHAAGAAVRRSASATNTG